MAEMIAKFKCWMFGHRRGKRVLMVTVTTTSPVNTFACPRCGTQWTRKAKA